jgi:hypothetical protein
MAEEWFNARSTSGLDAKALMDRCPQGMYYRFLPGELPQYFSSSLLSKVPGGVMVRSGPLFMINLYRLDGTMIDQQPFDFVLMSGVPLASGGYIQHGDWPGRTTALPPEAAKAIWASGIAQAHFFSGFPTASTGPVSELGPSDRAAFDKLANHSSGLLPPQTSN